MKHIQLSVILMVHNEEETIEKEIQHYHTNIIAKIPKSEMIVAEDGSTDTTRDILQRLQKKYKLILLTTPKKRGYAASLRLALEKAKGDVTFYADAGGKHNPRDFWKLYNQLKNFDLISGYKAKRHDPFYRLFLAWGLNILVTFYFSLPSRDIDSGFKVFNSNTKKKILSKKWLLKNNISLEIMLRAFYQGGKILEVAIEHRARKFGVSRGLPPKKILSVVISLLTNFPTLKRTMKKLREKTKEKNMLDKYTTMFPKGNYRMMWEGNISVVYKLPKYLRIIKTILGKKKQSVLEVGAGDGEIASYLLADPQLPITSYTVSEYSLGGVRQAKKVLAKWRQVRVKRMDATHLSSKDKSFDTVFAIDTMHHVIDPEKMGQEMIRVAKNKVFLIESNGLSIPRRLAELQQRYVDMGEKSYYPWQYQQFFSSPRVKSFSIQPFLFMIPRVPDVFIPVNIFISELLEKIPLLKWQCSGVIITVTLKK